MWGRKDRHGTESQERLQACLSLQAGKSDRVVVQKLENSWVRMLLVLLG